MEKYKNFKKGDLIKYKNKENKILYAIILSHAYTTNRKFYTYVQKENKLTYKTKEKSIKFIFFEVYDLNLKKKKILNYNRFKNCFLSTGYDTLEGLKLGHELEEI